jgi:uncharacterized protein (UPF0297 family)
MHNDSNIEQYLRISTSFRPKNWWIVSSQKEDYDIILGSGFHMQADKFLAEYDPDGKLLTRHGSSKPDDQVPQDVFVYYDRNIFKVDKDKVVQAKEVLDSVYQALKEKGYNPINQIVGYILSGDPTYITNHKNARSIIIRLERDELLEEIVRHYLEKK